MLNHLYKKYKDKFQDQKDYPEQSSLDDIQRKNQNIDSVLENNISIIKKMYSIPENSDVKIHNFTINGLNKKAALLFISTISDVRVISEHIIEPLLRNENSIKSIKDIIQVQSISEIKKIKDVTDGANQGNTVLFVDSDHRAYVIGTSNFQSRSVEKAENENVVKGPKEAFNEKVTTNISLIRKKIKNENLIVETTQVSVRSKNELYILYIKDLANDKLVKNIKERVSALEVDAIQNLSLLEQYIEERPASIFPSILYTERPDRAASFLEDGYIVLLMNNSPASLILPATFWAFIHNPEDHYLRFIYGNFIRILRVSALFITLFASAIYVSITNYHSEMVPTDLLLAISATREKVPFPSFFEILMMEIAFELIREAGLRVPSPIGPTIGIVGALILGQAAVQANIVSPIIVIVVALSGLCSFTISDISMNFAIRIIRFAFILSSGLFGIYGMASLFTMGLAYMVSIKSFGVPYLAPMSPKYPSSKDTIIRQLLKNEKIRPGYVKPKDHIKKQRN
ncbi:spore germination protein [Schinkia azotoformans]|uniref:GerKA2 spore germination GerA type complex n=1 Tax=Schinkia azotoformans LMG 9581 TaxID=1131731 RepID=K6DUV2_SCHAZ|nr:spore germination protein [Schinkia azotoformans]EKN64581.1 GerKA2 spore germination GerA type complex [Schinkia azotoformans LMG 9581]MEC1637889.1 spore germination protein [Schinkia azotoformans]MEC1944785.1 spore germination protein [Schinkia azotoformans]